MHDSDETYSYECRFLSADHFDVLHEKFLAAFADYFIPFSLSPDQFRGHVLLNAVDLGASVGCFVRDAMVGFSLNGIGQWNGRRTIYNAGTGVVPAFRRRGVSRRMFETMIPVFRERGFEQFLLEVITQNEPAIRLYESLGFRRTRKLLLLECADRGRIPALSSDGPEIRETDLPDLAALEKLWDGSTSWQNSVDAIHRSRRSKTILGAFFGDELAGYIVYSIAFGRVAQLAVSPSHRNKGVGARLIAAMNERTPPDRKLQVINLDGDIADAVNLFRSVGFEEVLAQYEMLLEL
jgi:ribosomal protein S18 acetylase RimI-like enzyme